MPSVIVVHVPGLSVDLAVRGDSVPNLCDLMADGTFAPVSPVFPVLDGPNWATIVSGRPPSEHGVLDDASTPDLPGSETITERGLFQAARTCGPRSAMTLEALAAFDATLGELRRRAPRVVVLSAYGLTEITRTLKAPGIVVSQIAYSADPSLAAHGAEFCEIAGKRMALAPPGASFEEEKGGHGRLPTREADYGVLITNAPLPSIRSGAKIKAEEVGQILKLLLRD